MSLPKFDTLVLGGGGAKGIAILGVLEYFIQKKKLDLPKPFSNLETTTLKRVSGTSIGSVIGALIAAGFSPREIYKLSINLKAFGEVPLGALATVQSFYGVHSVHDSIEPLTRALEDKLGKDLTFKKFVERTGIDFRVCAANVSGLQTVYFSQHTHPDILVKDALAASCCIPIIFQKVVINNNYYVDGGFVDNTPCGAWNDFHINAPTTLAISVSGFSKEEKIEGILSYIARISATSILARATQDLERYQNIVNVVVSLSNLPFLPSSITSKERKDMFMKGHAMAKAVDTSIITEL